MAMERLAEQPIIDKTDESTKLLGSTQGLNDNGEAVDTVRRIPFNLVAEALSKLGVFITVNESNIIGVTKNLGTFECVAIDDATNKYTFAVADTSIFVSSTEYKVTLDAVDYIVRTSKINEDTVVFVAVNDAVPFVVGNSYTIVFETVNATALGKGNTVLAHNALGAGYNNKIDETGDQSATFGYGHEVKGKNQMATGYNHDILGGEANVVIGSSNTVNGRYKLVAGVGLTSILTPNGATVLGKYNVDVENALFIIGGGADKNQKKNLLVMDKYGETILNGTLDVNGDIKINGYSLVSEIELYSHTGIDVGSKGSGIHAVIFGSDTNIASGINTFVTGAANTATNDQGTVFGYGNENHAKNALIMGLYNIIESGEGSVALGDNIRIYSKGAGIGTHLTVNGSRGGQIVVGRYNKEETEAVFIVGNGSLNGVNNAFVIYNDGSAKFVGAVDINGNLSALQITANGIDVKNSMNAKNINVSDSITTGSLRASGEVKGSNIYPIFKTFTANGNITNADTGEVVAEYNNGIVNFNIVPVSYGSGCDGVMIKNNKSLIVPIKPVTLQPGTYKKTCTWSEFTRLDDCNFKATWIDENATNIIDKGDYCIITKATVINKIYLKTDIADSDIPYNGTFRFHGEGVLSFNTTMVTNTTADLIGAATEYKEADGISTSLRLTSPNGTVFKITVDDNGALKTTKI